MTRGPLGFKQGFGQALISGTVARNFYINAHVPIPAITVTNTVGFGDPNTTTAPANHVLGGLTTASGSLLVVAVATRPLANPTTVTVADSVNGTYTRITGDAAPQTSANIDFFAFQNAAPIIGGNLTVTTTAGTCAAFRLWEIPGGTMPVDRSAHHAGGAGLGGDTDLLSGTTTISVGTGDIVIGAIAVGGAGRGIIDGVAAGGTAFASGTGVSQLDEGKSTSGYVGLRSGWIHLTNLAAERYWQHVTTGGNVANSGAVIMITGTTQPAPQWISDAPTPAGYIGQAYSYTFAASGSPAPTFAVASGTLPTGLTLDATSGTLSGTPSVGSAGSFTVTASNASGTITSPLATVTITAVPTGDHVVPYAVTDGPWNKTINAAAGSTAWQTTIADGFIDPASSTIITALNALGLPLTAEPGFYTPAVYLFDGSTPTVNVAARHIKVYDAGESANTNVATFSSITSSADTTTGDYRTDGTTSGDGTTKGAFSLPIPAGAQGVPNSTGQLPPRDPTVAESGDFDSQMILWNPTTGETWDLFRANFDGNGWFCEKANRYWTQTHAGHVYYGSGYADAQGGRGAGTTYISGLVRKWEMDAAIAAGPPYPDLGHALSFACAASVTKNTFRYPGTKSDGTAGGVFPEGYRLQLKPSVDLSGLSPQLQVIGLTMQKYGLYLIDNSGSSKFYVEYIGTSGFDSVAYGRNWPNVFTLSSNWNNFQVVSGPPSQYG